MPLAGLRRSDLVGKTIDVHAHVGVQLREAAQVFFPYCSSVEDLYYRQIANGVDATVAFPISPAFHWDLYTYIESGRLAPVRDPISPVPYDVENRLLLSDVYIFCPEHAGRFLPFVSADPGRMVAHQVAGLRELAEAFPIYGMKIHPLLAQAPVGALLAEGCAFLDLCAERDWPVMFHASTDATDPYSLAEDTFRVIESRMDVRFCLAHMMNFHGGYLERAHALPNCWVDSAALKIICQLVHEQPDARQPEMIDLDYADHVVVFRELVERYPGTMIWGSDSPFHSYITRRLQGETYVDFRLKGTYEQEKEALDSLPPVLRERVHDDALSFLFGKESCDDRAPH